MSDLFICYFRQEIVIKTMKKYPFETDCSPPETVGIYTIIVFHSVVIISLFSTIWEAEGTERGWGEWSVQVSPAGSPPEHDAQSVASVPDLSSIEQRPFRSRRWLGTCRA